MSHAKAAEKKKGKKLGSRKAGKVSKPQLAFGQEGQFFFGLRPNGFNSIARAIEQKPLATLRLERSPASRDRLGVRLKIK